MVSSHYVVGPHCFFWICKLLTVLTQVSAHSAFVTLMHPLNVSRWSVGRSQLRPGVAKSRHTRVDTTSTICFDGGSAHKMILVQYQLQQRIVLIPNHLNQETCILMGWPQTKQHLLKEVEGPVGHPNAEVHSRSRIFACPSSGEVAFPPDLKCSNTFWRLIS